MKVQERGASVYAVTLGREFEYCSLRSVSCSEAPDATARQRRHNKSRCPNCTESDGSSHAQGPGSGECTSPQGQLMSCSSGPNIQDSETLVGVMDGRGADSIKTGKGKRAGSILDQSV